MSRVRISDRFTCRLKNCSTSRTCLFVTSVVDSNRHWNVLWIAALLSVHWLTAPVFRCNALYFHTHSSDLSPFLFRSIYWSIMRLLKWIISVQCSHVISIQHTFLSLFYIFFELSFFSFFVLLPLSNPAFLLFLKESKDGKEGGEESTSNHYFHRPSLSITKTRGLISRSNVGAHPFIARRCSMHPPFHLFPPLTPILFE